MKHLTHDEKRRLLLAIRQFESEVRAIWIRITDEVQREQSPDYDGIADFWEGFYELVEKFRPTLIMNPWATPSAGPQRPRDP